MHIYVKKEATPPWWHCYGKSAQEQVGRNSSFAIMSHQMTYDKDSVSTSNATITSKEAELVWCSDHTSHDENGLMNQVKFLWAYYRNVVRTNAIAILSTIT